MAGLAFDGAVLTGGAKTLLWSHPARTIAARKSADRGTLSAIFGLEPAPISSFWCSDAAPERNRADSGHMPRIQMAVMPIESKQNRRRFRPAR
jgi:hypothetical protein